MRINPITGSPIDSQQSPTHSRPNSPETPPPAFARNADPAGQLQIPAAGNPQLVNATQPPLPLATSSAASTQPLTLMDQVRMAILNAGSGFTNAMLYEQFPAGPELKHGGVMCRKKNEFAFGMSDSERDKVFSTMRKEARSSGVPTNYYRSKSLVNTDAIYALRLAAKQWGRVPGNNIFGADAASPAAFFNQLLPYVDNRHQQAAQALITQSEGYVRPLPGTMAAGLLSAQQQPPSGNALPMVPTQTLPAAPGQQLASQPSTTSNSMQPPMQSGYGAGVGFWNGDGPSTTGKRFFGRVNDEPGQFDPSSTGFKRSRENDVHGASLSSTPPTASQSSTWSASNDLSRPAAQSQSPSQYQQQPIVHMPMVNNSGPQTYQGNRPFTHTTQSTATATATATAIRPQVLPGNPSAPTVSQGPVLSVAPSHLNGSQSQISSQQAPSQFADIDAFIDQRVDEIRRHEMSAPQVTSVTPQYQASMLPPVAQAPNNRFAGNVPSNPVPSANPAALQPDHSYNDLLALIDSLPVMEPGASTANSSSTFNQSAQFNQLQIFSQPAPLNQPIRSNPPSTFSDSPDLVAAAAGQPPSVWAQPTVAQGWNGGSTNAPQFVNPNQAYPQPLNQPQAPSQALVTMPGMYPTANSQFPTSFSNNPPFNFSIAPNPLAPSNSFHDYSQLLHQPQPQQQHQQQPQQHMAAPAFYSSMPMNSYSAQQINQYNGPASNYFAMPATNYSFMPGNSMPATATGASAMPAAPSNGVGGAGGMQGTGAPSAYPYQW